MILAVMPAQKGERVKHKPNWRIVKNTWNIYFGDDDSDAPYKELQERGAIIDYTIYNTPWGTREFRVQDVGDHDIVVG